MKNSILTLAVFTAVSVFSLGVSYAKPKDYPVHIMPDETIRLDTADLEMLDQRDSNYVTQAIKVGKKNMDWLVHMNSLRPEDQKIALTKKGELPPIPIHTPKIYSPATIEKEFKEISAEIPKGMGKIIFGNGSFSDNPDVDLETYIAWAKKVDKMYQTASRWSLIAPNLVWYKQNKSSDIRGYFFLKQEKDLQNKLEQYNNLSAEEKIHLKPLLIGLCENSQGWTTFCARTLEKAITDKQVYEFYVKYYPGAEKLFNNYFEIGGTRIDIRWSSTDPLKMYVPVRDTKSAEINHFLEFNNEDEWKWGDWSLDMYFTPNADIRVKFEPGSTPHVNGLGGNTITMDANAPLTEWDVQWTIRHEFGHVLGLPDCYVEFYDSSIEAMVNYQIDTENMMCSRAGRMQELHYNELKKAYFR